MDTSRGIGRYARKAHSGLYYSPTREAGMTSEGGVKLMLCLLIH